MNEAFNQFARLLREAVPVLSEAHLVSWCIRLRNLADEIETARRAHFRQADIRRAPEDRLWRNKW